MRLWRSAPWRSGYSAPTTLYLSHRVRLVQGSGGEDIGPVPVEVLLTGRLSFHGLMCPATSMRLLARLTLRQVQIVGEVGHRGRLLLMSGLDGFSSRPA